MPSLPPVCDFNWPAPDFQLPATDGRMLSRNDISGPKGCLIIFMYMDDKHFPFDDCHDSNNNSDDDDGGYEYDYIVIRRVR